MNGNITLSEQLLSIGDVVHLCWNLFSENMKLLWSLSLYLIMYLMKLQTQPSCFISPPCLCRNGRVFSCNIYSTICFEGVWRKLHGVGLLKSRNHKNKGFSKRNTGLVSLLDCVSFLQISSEYIYSTSIRINSAGFCSILNEKMLAGYRF